MLGHNVGDAWCDKEFKKIFNLFEEDEAGASANTKSGLDKEEFKKLVKRIAQLWVNKNGRGEHFKRKSNRKSNETPSK